jgi:hypothetical protein
MAVFSSPFSVALLSKKNKRLSGWPAPSTSILRYSYSIYNSHLSYAIPYTIFSPSHGSPVKFFVVVVSLFYILLCIYLPYTAHFIVKFGLSEVNWGGWLSDDS